MRITSRCTRGAVVGEFAGQVWSGTSTQPCLNPAPHVIVKRPSQRHGDPLEQCTLNLSLSSCDSPARPDGSARARRPATSRWVAPRHQRISGQLEDRVTRAAVAAMDLPGRANANTCGLHPMFVVAGTSPWRVAPKYTRRPSLNKREVQLTTRLAITRQREHAREREMVRRDRAKKAETT